ncbi:MAG: hypothetical protein KF830_12995 [Planctomycetes bacterium]|nr:hypothetical protein [Planctomycetota bacterium]
MRSVLASLVLAAVGMAQGTAPPPAPPGAAPSGPGAVRFDSGGWPILADDPAPAAGRASPALATEAARPAAAASGMQLGSPLLDVFQATRSPAAFRALGGVVVWWRLSIFGAQGEVIGMRELTHTADCGAAERDRLELADGRVYGRSGASVFAERQGMPWPTLADAAQHELALFGLHLRLPWCFGDGAAFAVVGRDTVTRGGDALLRIQLERRPPAGADPIGPEATPPPRDRYELLVEPSTGLPREFVHRFAASAQSRRVRLEDWRDVTLGDARAGGAVRLPFRRVYVDEAQRPTTQLEILRLEPAKLAERDFRLR